MTFMARALDNETVAREFAPKLIEMAATIERLAFGDATGQMIAL
jgi:hypothetical protein